MTEYLEPWQIGYIRWIRSAPPPAERMTASVLGQATPGEFVSGLALADADARIEAYLRGPGEGWYEPESYKRRGRTNDEGIILTTQGRGASRSAPYDALGLARLLASLPDDAPLWICQDRGGPEYRVLAMHLPDPGTVEILVGRY